MNRTGGTNSRIRKHSNKDDLARQKEHFARSRMRRDAANATLKNANEPAASSERRSPRESLYSRHFGEAHPAVAIPVMSGGNGRQTSEAPMRKGDRRSPRQSPPQKRTPEIISDVTSIATKKRRLLNQLDWTGVAVQKPLLINYPKPSKKLQESHTSHNLRKIPSHGTIMAHMGSQPDNIRVQVGSQGFR
ncbi:hypothetical protein E4U57_003006 [Claviceps arundinis]|uniref:Uncharacterized protein n=1 Tax=Claviceps arundinis TaxID=1623583 RepID=A0A9P7SQ72_9HYPO|nr:hypothetical protein E4U56_001488 [Claviceps arundinis]KAG5966175.1 hypothetical protein E4U57_003006 [Claviceps arundinis]